MTITQLIVCIVAGLGAGLGTGLAGLSAAAVVSPMLITFLHMPAYQAIGIALASDVLASGVSAWTYKKNKNIDIRHGVIMLISVLIFTLVGSFVSSLVPNGTMGGFSKVMTLFVGLKFIIRPIMTTKEVQANKSEKQKIQQSILCGVVIGFICGFVGAGGGMMLLLVLTLAVFMPVSANAAPKINQWVNKGRYRYYYNQKGKKVKNKVKQIGKFRYSFDKKGRMQTGWQIFGSKKAYFSKKSGRMQVNKKVDGVKIGKSGYVKRSKTELKEQKALEKAKQILAKITTSKMSKSQKLYAAFQYMTSRANFSYRTWRGFSVYDGWEYDYALEMYEKRAGNCYNFACGFAMLAKAIGYQPQVIAGRVPGGVDGAPDGFTRHSLVKINGLYYDPEAQFDGWARGVYGLGYYPMYLQILSIRTI